VRMQERKEQQEDTVAGTPLGYEDWDQKTVYHVKLSYLVYRSGGNVPTPAAELIGHLRAHCLDVEGLFRLSGRSEQVQELRDSFDKGEIPDLTGLDPHVVTGALKQWLAAL